LISQSTFRAVLFLLFLFVFFVEVYDFVQFLDGSQMLASIFLLKSSNIGRVRCLVSQGVLDRGFLFLCPFQVSARSGSFVPGVSFRAEELSQLPVDFFLVEFFSLLVFLYSDKFVVFAVLRSKYFVLMSFR